MHPPRSLLASLALLVTSAACSSESPGSEPGGAASPRGKVARDAAEAFPDAPPSVPALTRDALARACARAAECQLGQPSGESTISPADAVALASLCVDALVFSGERAIPISGLSSRASTADVWVGCVAAGTSCDGVRACDVERPRVTCQEDGCLGPSDWVETRCSGDAATIVTKSGDVTRSCALAHARCDPSSPTGCTDRPYSRCPDGDPRVDRCDGDVRLGCDRAGQVSYHDCRRLGGTCGLDARGTSDCLYPGVDACAGESPPGPSCAAGVLSLCVLGARVDVASATLCD